MTDILFRDEYIVVCDKPSGLLSEGEAPQKIFPVHRLDRETRGVMVYALCEKAAASLSLAVAERRMEKEYIATVVGRLEASRGEMKDLLFYDRGRNKSFVVRRERKGVKAASLEYELLDYNAEEDLSFVRVKLHTGRTHQIRVQFASRGYPLAGDRKYGAPPSHRSEPSLVAVKLSFPHPISGEYMTFEL